MCRCPPAARCAGLPAGHCGRGAAPPMHTPTSAVLAEGTEGRIQGPSGVRAAATGTCRAPPPGVAPWGGAGSEAPTPRRPGGHRRRGSTCTTAGGGAHCGRRMWAPTDLRPRSKPAPAVPWHPPAPRTPPVRRTGSGAPVALRIRRSPSAGRPRPPAGLPERRAGEAPPLPARIPARATAAPPAASRARLDDRRTPPPPDATDMRRRLAADAGSVARGTGSPRGRCLHAPGAADALRPVSSPRPPLPRGRRPADAGGRIRAPATRPPAVASPRRSVPGPDSSHPRARARDPLFSAPGSPPLAPGAYPGGMGVDPPGRTPRRSPASTLRWAGLPPLGAEQRIVNLYSPFLSSIGRGPAGAGVALTLGSLGSTHP